MSENDPATYDELHAEIRRLHRQIDDLAAERRQLHDALKRIRLIADRPFRDDSASAGADGQP